MQLLSRLIPALLVTQVLAISHGDRRQFQNDDNGQPKPPGRKLTHPGILHTQEDLDRMRYGVTNKLEPWYSAFLNMSTDPLASPSYKMQGPLPYATRNATGGSPGKTQISYDSVASLLNALMWYITEDVAYANKSIEILSGWANTLQLLNGTDAQLTAALYGPHFVNAAEIIRATYSGWPESEIEKFKSMILNVFYPPASQITPTPIQEYPFLANWGTAGEKAIVAFGVFLDNETMYHEGLNLYTNFACADLSNTINSMGQNCESGRDQAHTQLSLGAQAELCQVAYNQGDREYWDLLDDRLMVGYEYTAKYNLNYSVPYDPNFYRCGAFLVGGPWQNISAVDRGQWRPIYEIAYAYYVQRRGKKMPWTKMQIQQNLLETGDTANNIGDDTPYGTLRFSLLEGEPWASWKD